MSEWCVGEAQREQWRSERAEYWAGLLDEKRLVDAARGCEQGFTYYARDAIYRALEAGDKARAALAANTAEEVRRQTISNVERLLDMRDQYSAWDLVADCAALAETQQSSHANGSDEKDDPVAA
jgi:hypothetical protein